MFPTFISILDIQSWWEVPSIAHFCSLFRAAFNLLDFDIEDLEEALLTDGTEETSWLQELIVRLLSGCLANNDISTFNYQMFLRRLFRQKCQEHDRYNPFNTDIDFQFLPLRTKVEILQALCDFRLDAEDVLDHLKNLEADSLRVEPLGYDDNESAYWYFYGTRLYREDHTFKNSKKVKSVWQVICFTEEDWYQLARKFRKSSSKVERQLYRTLSENFLPELPRLFQEKEVLHRKRLLEWLPRRTSARLDIKRQQVKEPDVASPQNEPSAAEQASQDDAPEALTTTASENHQNDDDDEDDANFDAQSADNSDTVKTRKKHHKGGYEKGKKRKESPVDRPAAPASSTSPTITTSPNSKRKPDSNAKRHATEMAERRKQRELRSARDTKPTKDKDKDKEKDKDKDKDKAKHPNKEKGAATSANILAPGATPVGRQTNNSLASATGQIVIQSVSNPNRKKLKTSQVFRQSAEDLQTGMYKILEAVKNHEDAWPFVEPVEEEYAPNYYTVIRRPMDLQRMEDKLDMGAYVSYGKFRQDFQLIVDNCRLYNGTDNEYTEMVDNLQQAFQRATDRYLDQISSSDEEIAVEFQGSTKDSRTTSTGNTQTKRKKPDSATTTPVTSKRKPTSMAHTADKRERERSMSVESNHSLIKSPEVTDKPDKTKNDKPQKNTRSSKVTAPTKTAKNAKNDAKVLKHNRRGKKMQSPERSRSRSRSPKKNNKSPSWPPSSPEHWKSAEKRDTSPSVTSARGGYSSEEEKKIAKPTKTKGKHKHWKEVFKDKEKKNQVKTEKSDKPDKVEKIPEKEVSKPKEIIKPKNKNPHLSETIEKLKAKSELALSDDGILRKKKDEKKEKKADKETLKEKPVKKTINKTNKTKANKKCEYDFEDEDEGTKDSTISEKKGAKKIKKSNVKNVADIEALDIATEQTLKDINKWLDDTPRFPDFSSASNSPSHFIGGSVGGPPDIEPDPTTVPAATTIPPKIDDFKKKVENKPSPQQRPKDPKDMFKRRLANKDPAKLVRRREIQRTIERLQPGKSKGNLLSNIQNTNKPEELFPLGPLSKLRESKNSLVVKTDDTAPKLSLGTVLDSFGQQHNFSEDVEKIETETKEVKDEVTEAADPVDPVAEVKPEEEQEVKKDETTNDNKPVVVPEKKEVKAENKATPNLSAWFKAFGAPKVQVTQKKKQDNEEEKKEPEVQLPPETAKIEPSKTPPEEARKVISPEPESPAAPAATRQRRGSTGSSVSERSSFSQDMDSSPRMSIDERIGAYPAPYPSPLHRSPASASPVMASPRQEDPQRPYPTLNGSIRVGFYQDTVSTKSSPDKSCSPRDQPQSPYQQFSEHVYTPPNTIQGSGFYSNPSYYSQNPNYTNPSPVYGERTAVTNPSPSPVYGDRNQTPNSPVYERTPVPDPSPPVYGERTAVSNPSPVYGERTAVPNPSPPVYGDRSAPPFYDTTKSLTEQYNATKVPNIQPASFQSTSEDSINSPETPANPETFRAVQQPLQQIPQPQIPQQQQQPPSQQPQQQLRIPEKQPTMFPVKKRLYSENEAIQREDENQEQSQHLQQQQLQQQQQIHHPQQDIPGNRLEMGLLSGRQLNINTSTQHLSTNMQEIRPSSREQQQQQQQQKYVQPETHPPEQTYQRPDSRGLNIPINKPFDTQNQMNLQQNINMQLPNQQLNIPMRSMNFPTTSANLQPYNLQNHENTYSMNRPPETEDRSKLDMTKLANMCYSNVDMSRSQFYNRPPSAHTTSNTQAQNTSAATPTEHMNLSMRYASDTRLAMGYRAAGLEIPRTESQTTQMAPIQNADMIQVPQATRTPAASMTNRMGQVENYKQEMSIPRSSFTSPSGLIDQSLNLRGNLANLSNIVDRFHSDDRLLSSLQTSTAYYSDKGLSSPHMFAKSISTANTVTSSLPMFSQPSIGIQYGREMQQPYTRTMTELQNPSMFVQSGKTMHQQPPTYAQSQQVQQNVQQQQQQQQQQVQQQQVQQQQQQVQQTVQQQQQQVQIQPDKKSSRKRKTKQQPIPNETPPSTINTGQGFQSYAGLKNSTEPSAISLKTASVVPGSAFNFGPGPNALGLSSGLYGEKDSYTGFLDEYRSAPSNYYMHRTTPETSTDKSQPRNAHQQTPTAPPASFPFLGHPQPRAPGYASLAAPFMGAHTHQSHAPLMDPNSPIYQQYLLHQGLLGPPAGYPPGYHPALSMRQPYDSMTRPSWL